MTTNTTMAVVSAASSAAIRLVSMGFTSNSSNSATTTARPIPSLTLSLTGTRCRSKAIRIACQVALNTDSSIQEDEEEELKSNLEKVGRKVKVKAPLKVYHIPKLSEFELTPDMVGVIKQYVGFWKGKRISPNLPFKVEFLVDIQGRGPVKFFAHLKEDEFDILQEQDN